MIAEGVVCGVLNKIITFELGLGESTVKENIRSIMKKLRAENRTKISFKQHAVKSDLRLPTLARLPRGWKPLQNRALIGRLELGGSRGHDSRGAVKPHGDACSRE